MMICKYLYEIGKLQISSLLVNYLFASCSYFKCKYGFHLYKGVKFLTDPIMYVDWKAKKMFVMNRDIYTLNLAFLFTPLIFQVKS